MNTLKPNLPTIPYGTILNEIFPMLHTMSEMQRQGALFLPGPLSYALGKNYGKCLPIVKRFNKTRAELMEQYIQKDDKGNFMRTPDGQKHIFINESSEKEFRKKIREFDDTRMEWNPHKIFEGLLKEVGNLPIEYLTKMEEYGMLTEIDILQPAFKRPQGQA